MVAGFVGLSMENPYVHLVVSGIGPGGISSILAGAMGVVWNSGLTQSCGHKWQNRVRAL